MFKILLIVKYIFYSLPVNSRKSLIFIGILPATFPVHLILIITLDGFLFFVIKNVMLHEILVKTTRKTELVDITYEIEKLLPNKDGICILFNPHTTAGLIVNEGADPSVKEDILAIFNQLAPERFPYRHLEGNSPGHVKSALTGPTLILIVEKGKLILGTWQKVFFAEYDGPRNRKIYLKFIET